MQLLPGNIELSSNLFEKEVWNILKDILKDENGILGYKIPALGNKHIEDVPSFIIRSRNFGIILIDVLGDRITEIDEDGRFWIKQNGDDVTSRDFLLSTYKRDVENRLSKSTKLYNYKDDTFNIKNIIQSILIFSNNTTQEILQLQNRFGQFTASSLSKNDLNASIKNKLKSLVRKDINEDTLDELDSILEGTSVFNKRRKRLVLEPNTRNDLIKKSLIETFKLDETQRSVALQIPNGPQRIRGLAGTGKTIILSMKAALTHIFTKDNKFNILFVFNTQSMYKQIIENIENYTIEESSTAPDWDRLKVLHAWGGVRKEGLYSMLCEKYSIPIKSYFEARRSSDPMQYIYQDLLKNAKDKIKPIFDMVLIDEAQDFPPAFFETIYYITKDPKRIIWAYDEFQSLNELKIAEPSNIFGHDETGKPNMEDSILMGEYEGGIEKDYMLPNSYRNPRKVLMYAHGLGLGLYSNDAKVPMEDRISWEARGYKIIEPINKDKFEQDDHIVVERPKEYSRNILEGLIETSKNFKTENIITYNNYSSVIDELNSVVKSIRNLIKVDLIEPEEIIVISLDRSNAQKEFDYLRSKLLADENFPIRCITPGFVEPSDKFKEKGRVTLTTPFRAKGNEANVIFVVNAQIAIGDKTLRERNALFVSITRSRGWCYISGNNEKAIILQKEINKIDNNYPFFDFTFPKKSDYERRVKIISQSDKNLTKAEKQIDEILSDDSNLALLIEKAKDNSELLRKIKEMLGEND